MVTALEECTKNMIKKMNLFVILQFIWIVEFYFLAFLATNDFFCNKIGKQIVEPHVIKVYSQIILNWIQTYNGYLLFTGIIFLVVGLSGMFFKFIPCLNQYQIIYIYSDFGLYAGCWILLIYFTYKIYENLMIFFLLMPIVVWLLFILINKIKEILELHGITFG